MEQIQEFETEARNDLIEGRNAVMEALRAGRTIDKIFIAKGDVDKTLGHIASKARSAGIVVTEADRRKLDAMSQTHAHQGVIALCAVKEYSTIEDMLAIAAERGEAPFLVLCDEISDPHNLGAIIRTAECVGAHGVIIPKRRSAGLTAVVNKASAGALEHMAVARVPNLVAAIETLKKNGLWIYGTAARGLERAVENGPDRPGLHRHRVGGRRHQPSGTGKMRFSRQHSAARADLLAQRICGRSRAAL